MVYFKKINSIYALTPVCLSFFSVGNLAIAATVASVNDVKIDTKELTAEFSQLPSAQKKQINSSAQTKKEIVENAVNAEVLYQEAKKQGLDSDEEFKRAQDRFRRQYLSSKLLQGMVEKQLTESQVKDYFEKNKNSYDSTQVKAMHILVSSEGDAKKLFEQAKKIKADKEFAELAKKNSIDPSVQDNGGDLGFFTRDRMIPEFSLAAFSMKKGETKGPIKSMYGFHIIRLIDIKPGKVPSYSEVEGRVKDSYRGYLVQQTLAKLREKAAVKIYEDQLSSFEL